MAKEKIQVSIFDEAYTLVTDEPEEHLKAAAALVDEIMRNTASAGVQGMQKMAILTALQLASRYLRKTSETQQRDQEYELFNQWLRKQDKALSDLV